MASIRRTLSPAHHDRLYLNGGGSFSASSPSHKFLPTPGCTSSGGTVARFMYSLPFMVMGSVYRAFLIGICPKKYSRLFEKSKRGQVWKKSLLQFFLCFMLGLLSGFTPFSLVDLSANLSSKRQDFSFELKSPMVNSRQDFSRVVKRGRAIETVKSDGIVAVELEAKRDVESKVLAVPKFDFVPRKLLIIVTPTFNRALQAYHLNRLAQTLRLVPPPLLWIVVEMPSASMETAEILMRAGVMHRHLVCKKNLTSIKDRGVHQRNEALEHIRHHNIDGIVYFADDDNVYSLKLFKQMRDIRRFGTCPVAMLAQSKNKVILEGPVCNASKVIGWHTNEKSKRLRRFHVDMSGFAFNSTILWDPKRWHRPTSDPIKQLDTVKEGFQETTFIEQIVEDEGQMEGLPHGCSQIMAWHLHLEAPDLVYPKGWFLQKNLDCIIPLKHVGTA